MSNPKMNLILEGLHRPISESTKDPIKDMQGFTDQFGFGISVEKLADKVYNFMKSKGYSDVCMVNSKYLDVEGTTYLFSKSKKAGKWIVKTI